MDIKGLINALKDPAHPLHQKMLHRIEKAMQQYAGEIFNEIEETFKERHVGMFWAPEWQALKDKFTKSKSHSS